MNAISFKFFIGVLSFLLSSMAVAQSGQAQFPAAQQVCLEQTAELHKHLQQDTCKWEAKEKETWDEQCSNRFRCSSQSGGNGVEYLVCSDKITAEVGVVTDTFKNLFRQQEETSCKDDRTHLKSCIYTSGKTDGDLAGDNKYITQDDCKVPLKQQNSTGTARPQR